MKAKSSGWLLAGLACALGPMAGTPAARAQTATDGAIAGQVLDTAGAPVAGALVLGVLFLGTGFGAAVNGIMRTSEGFLFSIPTLIEIVTHALFRQAPLTDLSPLQEATIIAVPSRGRIGFEPRQIRPVPRRASRS